MFVEGTPEINNESTTRAHESGAVGSMAKSTQWRTKIHYNDVIISAMASQITSLTIVYSIVYSGADQRKHESSASLAFVRVIHRGPVNSPHKWPVMLKMFPFDDVIRTQISWKMISTSSCQLDSGPGCCFLLPTILYLRLVAPSRAHFPNMG